MDGERVVSDVIDQTLWLINILNYINIGHYSNFACIISNDKQLHKRMQVNTETQKQLQEHPLQEHPLFSALRVCMLQCCMFSIGGKCNTHSDIHTGLPLHQYHRSLFGSEAAPERSTVRSERARKRLLHSFCLNCVSHFGNIAFLHFIREHRER